MIRSEHRPHDHLSVPFCEELRDSESSSYDPAEGGDVPIEQNGHAAW